MLKKLISIALFVIIIATCLTAFASNSKELECEFGGFFVDGDGNPYAKVSGSARNSITVCIYDAKFLPVDFSSKYVPAALMQFDIPTGENTFDIQIPIDKELPFGEYNVRVTAKNNTNKFFEKCLYINEKVASEAVKEINDAMLKSSDEVEKKLKEKSGFFLISDEKNAKYTEFVSEIFYARRQNDKKLEFKSATELIETYNEAMAIYDVINHPLEKTYKSMLEENKENLKLDFDKYYNNLSDTEKTELVQMLEKTEDWKQKRYAEVFNEMSAFVSIKNVERWVDIKKIITASYKDVLKIATDVNVTDEVFRKMMNYEYNKYSDIKENYNKAVQEVDNKSNTTEKRIGGGGGSGGGVSIVGNVKDYIGTNTVDFKDVSDNHWAFKEIEYLTKNNIISGYSDATFGGEKAITRAEFAKILTVAFNIKSDGPIPFDDIDENAWYKKYIQACYGQKIIMGMTENKFGPNEFITREDATVMIYRLLKNELSDVNTDVKFEDSDQISKYAQTAVEVLYKNNIIRGVENNQFAPKEKINRYSAAKLIYNVIVEF